MNLWIDNPARLLAAIVESSEDAILSSTFEGVLTSWNRAAERLVGFPATEIVGRSLRSIVAEEECEQTERVLARIERGEHVEPYETVWRRNDGGSVHVSVTVSPIHDETGQRLGASFIAREFTQQRHVAERLQAEAKFRGLLESAPDGIVVVDQGGGIEIVNTQIEHLFGYNREELIGQPIEVLVPERFRESHVHDRERYVQAARTRPMGAGRALTGRKKDGTEIPVEISLSPLHTQQGTVIMSIVRDITERRKVEQQITASLREKEVLLKEIHHRVKNNLQVTSSLLKLQSGYIQDRHALEMFNESQNRIRSMALVHEKLYQSNELSRIHFAEYVQSLGGLLFRSYGVNANAVQFRVEGDALFLTVDIAVPCGLIVNELISNSLKHAFPGGRGGEVRVRIAHLNGGEELLLSVADNGVGLPPGLDIQRAESLGLQLVRMLTRQLSGTLEFETGGWTQFRVRFPLPKTTS